MDRPRLSFRFRVIGYYIFVVLIVTVLSEPIGTENKDSFLERYVAASSRGQNSRANGISSFRPSSHVERTNSRLDELENRLVALESEYQNIKEKNKVIEKNILQQEGLNQQQRELVSTLERIVGSVSPSDRRRDDIDGPPHRTPPVDRRNPSDDVGSGPPPTAQHNPVGGGQGSDQDDRPRDDSIPGNNEDHSPETNGQTESSGTLEEDLLEVNEYLGNMEAQLVQLNPNGDGLVQQAAEDFGRVSTNPSLYGKALLHLDEQNSLLRTNFAELLQNVEEFEERLVRLLKGNNQTTNVLQTPGDDTVYPQGGRGSGNVLDEIMRDLDPFGDEDIAERKVSGKSGFSVASSESQLGIQNQAQIVKFDYVFVNKGNNFKTDNSTFVCEIPGYYYFSYSVRSYDHRYLGIMLMKNDDYQVAIYTDSDERSVMESQSVMIHLTTGDAVWLRLSPSSKYGLYSDQYHITTFSGILTYKGD